LICEGNRDLWRDGLNGLNWQKRSKGYPRGNMSDIATGTVVGGYRILDEVGQGGMATVFKAHQISMDRHVAIKVLPRQFLNETVSLERFKQEASIVARLEHRAVVPVHDYGEYEGIPYIVMRYMDGGSVDDRLSKGLIPPDQTLSIVLQIAPALDYAHREGVLHRDLKPSNILLDSNGDAYVTDFGIARIVGPSSKHLTTSGVVGTPSYMSPEQAQGHELDGRSDVYALGVVLFEMLTGVRPFEGETPYSVAVKHVTEPPPSACALNPQLNRAVELVLFKALAKKPEMRYQTATELALALETAINQGEYDTGPVRPEQAETEPSLNEALRSGAARSAAVPVPPSVQQPMQHPQNVDGIRQPSPQIQVMPPYVSSMSRSYSGGLVLPRRRRRNTWAVGWLTWLAVGLLVGGVLLAVVLGIAYYVVNSESQPPDPGSVFEDYNATAIYKLTATRRAIEQVIATTSTPPPGDTTPAGRPTPVVTSPPTNTARPPTALVPGAVE
jgi:serine/threonine protein kinase